MAPQSSEARALLLPPVPPPQRANQPPAPSAGAPGAQRCCIGGAPACGWAGSSLQPQPPLPCEEGGLCAPGHPTWPRAEACSSLSVRVCAWVGGQLIALLSPSAAPLQRQPLSGGDRRQGRDSAAPGRGCTTRIAQPAHLPPRCRARQARVRLALAHEQGVPTKGQVWVSQRLGGESGVVTDGAMLARLRPGLRLPPGGPVSGNATPPRPPGSASPTPACLCSHIPWVGPSRAFPAMEGNRAISGMPVPCPGVMWVVTGVGYNSLPVVPGPLGPSGEPLMAPHVPCETRTRTT